MQLSIVEFAQNKLGLDAFSSEFEKNKTDGAKVIGLLTEWQKMVM